jgi:hypothetical protein
VTWAQPLKLAPSTTSDPNHVNPAVALTQNGNRLLVSYYVQQSDERLRTDIARLHVDGNHLRLEAIDRLSSTAFDLTPSNIPLPQPGDPFVTVNYDLADGTCHVLGEYQSIGVTQNGDDSGPIIAAWQTFAAVGQGRANRWHRAFTPSQTCSQRVLILNRIRWRLAAEVIDPAFVRY